MKRVPGGLREDEASFVPRVDGAQAVGHFDRSSGDHHGVPAGVPGAVREARRVDSPLFALVALPHWAHRDRYAALYEHRGDQGGNNGKERMSHGVPP